MGLKLGSKYRANAYRREALKEVCKIPEAPEVLNLMKRVALKHYGREKVASLTGDAWWEFIETHSSVKIYTLLKNYCNDIVYKSNTIDDPKYVFEIRTMAKLWIKTHGSKR